MIYHEKCEDRFPLIEEGSLDFIFTDPPFNASKLMDEVTITVDGHTPFKRQMGEWDKQFNPLYFLEQAARVLKPGGWLIIKTGDVLFGEYRLFTEEDWQTTEHILKWMFDVGVLDHVGYWAASTRCAWMDEEKIPDFEYMMTVCWHKTNPAVSVRQSTLVSSCEWIQVIRRLDEKGKSVRAPFNWINQNAMHNFIEAPICQAPERLYWHIKDRVLIPCIYPGVCELCAKGVQRRNHPTQTPLRIWEWVYRRFTGPGMKGYDPFCGVGSTIKAASKFGLEIFGSEQEWEFATAGNMWLQRKWGVLSSTETGQMEAF